MRAEPARLEASAMGLPVNPFMHISQYINEEKLAQYVREGLVEVRNHKTLPLRLYTHTRRTVLENFWDEITTKTRGLIVSSDGEIIARPFEKFFNVDTTFRPETHISNLPLERPTVAEKLDGSLGILYTWDGLSYIATKGSFYSEQAEWATKWYHDHVGQDFKKNYYGDVFSSVDKWPRGYTPIFEIIAESVQHHVVHYHGQEEMILLALINDETGEEMGQEDLSRWAIRNGMLCAQTYNKSLGTVLNEDRKNAEGYVISWPREGQSPLKVKIKHDSFLALQKMVHAATPQAILEALQSKNVDLLNTWIGQSGDQLGQWVNTWVVKINFKFAEILLKSKAAHDHALSRNDTRAGFAKYVLKETPEYAAVAFAMLDGKDCKRVVWKLVEKAFEGELSKAFSVVDTEEIAA